MKTRIYIGVVVLLLLIVAGYVVFTRTNVSGRNQAPTAQVVSAKVGAILPLTGTAAFYGEQGRKGIEIAKTLNEASGVQVEPVYLDSAYTGP